MRGLFIFSRYHVTVLPVSLGPVSPGLEVPFLEARGDASPPPLFFRPGNTASPGVAFNRDDF